LSYGDRNERSEEREAVSVPSSELESVAHAIERAAGHLAEHPEDGSATDSAAVAFHDGGLRVRVDGKHGAVRTDMTKAVGGDEAAPSPGWLFRAALAACDATIIAMEAARAGVELTRLEVSVESNSDFRGILGVDDSVQPGPLAVDIRIRLAADDASAEQLREIAERAEARSPVRDAVARAVPVTTEITTS
jgi:uncharacterized OsmC-like protein